MTIEEYLQQQLLQAEEETIKELMKDYDKLSQVEKDFVNYLKGEL